MYSQSKFCIILGLLATMACSCMTTTDTSLNLTLKWEKLPPIPDPSGFGSPFAGVLNDKLIVAGGANFPDAPPWEGGKKLWHDSIFILSEPTGKWKKSGTLPRPMGYGVSVTTPRGIVCIGGSDAVQHYRDVFLLEMIGDEVRSKPLASLPRPLSYSSGALLGNVIYVAGGTEEATATNTLNNFWALDLSEVKPVWREIEPCPGPSRMLGVAAAIDGAFYFGGGSSLTGDAAGKPVRKYLTDMYRYQPGAGWKRVADLPRPAVGSAFPAPSIGKSTFLVLSGDDGTKLGFQPPSAHPGFAKDILAYNSKTDSWKSIGEVPLTQVTVPAVHWRGRYVLPNGEIRPGVRTPDVWSFRASE
ncbi:MAG TPA: galactose oxidase [Verrucomicrobia subdivision 3 bacterium]|nr:galactose oxidase [Limisphaerales bacterium]